MYLSARPINRNKTQCFFGRGEKPNISKAFEAYSWAAERGCTEAMYMKAWVYRVGSSSTDADADQCRLWLERAAEKGYAPAMNDLAVTLLGEADRTERAHPELRVDAGGVGGGAAGAADSSLDAADDDCSVSSTKRRRCDDDLEGAVDGHDGQVVEPLSGGLGEAVGGRGEEGDDVAENDCNSLSPELAQLFEQVMEKRKRSMQLLQDAAKTGHTEVGYILLLSCFLLVAVPSLIAIPMIATSRNNYCLAPFYSKIQLSIWPTFQIGLCYCCFYTCCCCCCCC